MFGKPLTLDEQQLAKLTTLIQKHFGLTEAIEEVLPLVDGANQNNHFAAKTKAPHHYYGLKFPARVPHGPENEKLISDIALTLDAPNVCRIIRTNEIDFVPVFKGKDINVAEWMPNSGKLSLLAPDRKAVDFRLKLGRGFHLKVGHPILA